MVRLRGFQYNSKEHNNLCFYFKDNNVCRKHKNIGSGISFAYNVKYIYNVKTTIFQQLVTLCVQLQNSAMIQPYQCIKLYNEI